MGIWVPKASKGIKCIKLKSVTRLSGTAAQVRLETDEGKLFYVLFPRSQTVWPLDHPVLVHPEVEGAFKAFWVMSDPQKPGPPTPKRDPFAKLELVQSARRA